MFVKIGYNIIQQNGANVVPVICFGYVLVIHE